MDDDRFIKECPILFKKYKVKKKIGQGAFGAVFLGQTIKDNKYVAIKVERRKISKPLLESEAYLLSNLKGLGIPKIISFGKTRFYTVLIEPLFGKTLFDIFIQNGKQFHLEELCLIALQVIERLETIHAQYIIHRDIKPDNFLIGREDPNIIYLVDFGLSKKYRSQQTGRHVKFRNTGKLTGTLRFASPNALRGGEQSRKDDLISAGYMLIYLFKKKLPWQVIKAQNSTDKYIKIYRMKKAIKPEQLCQTLPQEFVQYMRYVQNLGFESNPDYNYLKKLFHHILKGLNLNADKLLFSWIKQSDIKKIKKKANPRSRNSSPQQRLYEKIKSNLQKKQRDNSSSDSSENNSYDVIPKIINTNPNIRFQRNYSKDNLEGSDMTKLTSKNNTIFVNFDKTINNKIEKAFEIIDNQLDSNSKDTSNYKNEGILSQKIVQVANKLNNNVESKNNVPTSTQNFTQKISDILKENQIPKENENIDENLKKLKEDRDKFYNKNKIVSNDDIDQNKEINNYLYKKNSGEQIQKKNSLNENLQENKHQINMGVIDTNNIITPPEKKLKHNNLRNDEIQKILNKKKDNNAITNQNLNSEAGNILPINNNNNINALQKINQMKNNNNNMNQNLNNELGDLPPTNNNNFNKLQKNNQIKNNNNNNINQNLNNELGNIPPTNKNIFNLLQKNNLKKNKNINHNLNSESGNIPPTSNNNINTLQKNNQMKNNNNMNQNLNIEFGNVLPKNNNNFNQLQKNNQMINNNNMNVKKVSKLNNNNKNMKNPNVKKINQKKLNSGNLDNNNLMNKNNNNYFPSNTDNNEDLYDFMNNKKNNRNMQNNLFDNNNSNNNNFITYTEPSDSEYNRNMKIHKVQTEQINKNKNSFQLFKEFNNDIYGNNDYNMDSNNLKINNNMNQYNQMNKNMLMNNKNINNGINGINKQMEPKIKCQKIQNNNNLRKNNKIIGNNNMNMNINLNMNNNNKMMINRNINGNINQINNNLNNPYNNQGINRQNRMMMNNNYYPNNNMMPNDNDDYMQNYNIQNNNNNQGQMSDYHHRYEMNNSNKNFRPFRFDNQQYQDLNEL